MAAYHQLKYSSPNHSKKTRAIQKSPPFGKWRFRAKEIRRMGQKRLDRNSDRTRQKNKRGHIEKWDQTDSPEIPDRGGRQQKSLTSLWRATKEKATNANVHLYKIIRHFYILCKDSLNKTIFRSSFDKKRNHARSTSGDIDLMLTLTKQSGKQFSKVQKKQD